MLLFDYSRQAAEFLESIPEKHAGRIVRKIVSFAEAHKPYRQSAAWLPWHEATESWRIMRDFLDFR